MDDETAKIFWNPDLEHLALAKAEGIYEPLARYIEDGGTLHPETRAWLAKLLRGELPAKKPGAKRTREQELQDWKLLVSIQEIRLAFDCTENAAIERLCEQRGANKDTVKTALRRMKRFRGLGLWPGF